jgi:hypothetical protein
MEKPLSLSRLPMLLKITRQKTPWQLVEKQAAILITDKEAVEKLGTVVTELIHNEKPSQ